jgi:hypothetical protein
MALPTSAVANILAYGATRAVVQPLSAFIRVTADIGGSGIQIAAWLGGAFEAAAVVDRVKVDAIALDGTAVGHEKGERVCALIDIVASA